MREHSMPGEVIRPDGDVFRPDGDVIRPAPDVSGRTAT
jgi:hypothetical protein